MDNSVVALHAQGCQATRLHAGYTAGGCPTRARMPGYRKSRELSLFWLPYTRKDARGTEYAGYQAAVVALHAQGCQPTFCAALPTILGCPTRARMPVMNEQLALELPRLPYTRKDAR